jgi:release factor glutamine methyltransferase
MDKLQSLVEDGERRLRAAGVESPLADAEWLMAEVCAVRRSELILRRGTTLAPAQRERWNRFLALRCSRIPLQHILGTAPFRDLTLAVNRFTLIPRPETEQLVEILIGHFAGRPPPASILDLGTGTGACILALGAAFPSATLTACDICPQALALARHNGASCMPGKRLTFLRSDWFSAVQGRWDLIVSNPPYLTEREWETAQREVREHEPKLALLGGTDGADCLRHILRSVANYLAADGVIALEMGIGHGDILLNLGKDLGISAKIFGDLSGRERFFVGKMHSVAAT